MIEAVPLNPYSSSEDPDVILSVPKKHFDRRRILESYFTLYGIAMASVASYPMLGTPGHIPLKEKEIEEL